MTGWRSGVLAALVAGAALMLPARAHGAKVILPRPGEIGFAGLAQYGSFLKGGEMGEDFRAGPGFALRLRYRMRYERAVGLTFERHGFEPRNSPPPPPPPASDTTVSKLTLLCTGVDIYQMFGTKTRAVKMLSAGVGLAQATQKLNNKETRLSGEGVGDGFYVSVGGGVEYYFWRSWAMDFSFRYHAVILHESTNHDFQIGAGLVFYATD